MNMDIIESSDGCILVLGRIKGEKAGWLTEDIVSL
jgi:hypothetical protein